MSSPATIASLNATRTVTRRYQFRIIDSSRTLFFPQAIMAALAGIVSLQYLKEIIAHTTPPEQETGVQ